MECVELDSPDLFFLDGGDATDFSLETHLESSSSAGAKNKAAPGHSHIHSHSHSRRAQLHRSNAPVPPPLPGTSYYGARRKAKAACRRVPEGVLDSWDRLFLEGYQSDLRVSTDGGAEISSHSCVLVSFSSVRIFPLVFSWNTAALLWRLCDCDRDPHLRVLLASSCAGRQIPCPESYAGGS